MWYAGTADAVYQNIDIIEDYGPRYIVILAGDHIYKMDYELMLQQHVDSGADVTVGCLEVPRMEATGFGVMHVDKNDRIVSFLEKPADPPGIPGPAGARSRAWASTCSRRKFLYRPAAARCGRSRTRAAISARTSFPTSSPTRKRSRTVSRGRACGRAPRNAAYWRDVGTVDAYWEANIDLTDVVPALDLYDRDWPIWTYAEITPPAKFVHDVDGRRGMGIASLVSGGCIVSGALLRQSLLFTGVQLHSIRQRRRMRSSCPTSKSAAARGSRKRHRRRAACIFPQGSWSARIPCSTPSASAAPRAASA